jgi:hypothetical protein
VLQPDSAARRWSPKRGRRGVGDDRWTPVVSLSGAVRREEDGPAQLGLAAGWLGRRPAELRCCAGVAEPKSWVAGCHAAGPQACCWRAGLQVG